MTPAPLPTFLTSPFLRAGARNVLFENSSARDVTRARRDLGLRTLAFAANGSTYSREKACEERAPRILIGGNSRKSYKYGFLPATLHSLLIIHRRHTRTIQVWKPTLTS